MKERMDGPGAEARAPRTKARVIVFDAQQESRERLRGALERLGHSVQEVKTPLEAVYAMSRASKDACVAFLGACLTATTPSEFVGFALEEFPRLLLVTAGVDVDADGERVHRLKDDDEDASALSALLARLLPEPPPSTQLA